MRVLRLDLRIDRSASYKYFLMKFLDIKSTGNFCVFEDSHFVEVTKTYHLVYYVIANERLAFNRLGLI